MGREMRILKRVRAGCVQIGRNLGLVGLDMGVCQARVWPKIIGVPTWTSLGNRNRCGVLKMRGF